jgi:hypothetical protein
MDIYLVPGRALGTAQAQVEAPSRQWLEGRT